MTPSVRTPNRDLATLKYRYSLRRGLFSEIDAVVLAGRPSYVARTKFDTLKLLENLDPDGGPDPGATSIGWWRRRESNPRPKIQHRRNLHAYPPLIVSLPAWKGGGNRRKPSPD